MQLDSSQQILDVDAAYSLNSQAFASIHQALMNWVDRLAERITKAEYQSDWNYSVLLNVARDALVVASATFSQRYGTGEDNSHQDALHYHNSGHALDIVKRVDAMSEKLDFASFTPERRVLLILFAVCHDLEQNIAKPPIKGVGANEWRSAEEAEAIIDLALDHQRVGAADAKQIRDYFAPSLRYMIYGTTFNFGPRTEVIQNLFTGIEAEVKIPTGALAPLLVEHIRALDSEKIETLDKGQLVDNILLGADIDTANVSDDFYDFALQGVNLCRELEKRRGVPACDPQTTYNFMTAGQEYYFHSAQRYNSELSQLSFAEAKELNAKRLSIATSKLRHRFGNPQSDFKTLESEQIKADDIFHEYLSIADSLRHSSLEQLNSLSS